MKTGRVTPLVRSKMHICWAGALLALMTLKPAFPVWAGMALILMAVPRIGRGGRSVRRAELVCAAGIALVTAGLIVAGAPWNTQVQTAAQARQALPGLLTYCGAMLGAPVLAWNCLSIPARPTRRVRVCRLRATAPRPRHSPSCAAGLRERAVA